MAEKPKDKSSGFGLAIAYVIFACLLGIFSLMPVKAFEETWQAEQKETISYGGEKTNAWILSQSSVLVSGTTKFAIDLSSSVTSASYAGFGIWILSRIQSTLIWVSLISYRVYLLIMWALLGFPFFIAAAVDAYYTREINKDSFVSQSPIRHKMGVKLFYMVNFMLIAWLILPIHVPTLLIPILDVLMAMSSWMWIVNLQKRL